MKKDAGPIFLVRMVGYLPKFLKYLQRMYYNLKLSTVSRVSATGYPPYFLQMSGRKLVLFLFSRLHSVGYIQ